MRRTTQIRPRRSRSQAGVAAVETAMVLGYFIGFLFLSFQIGLVAYYQISLDAAAEMQSRYVGLGGMDDATATNLVNAAIPNVQIHSQTHASSNQNPANIDTAGMDAAFGFGSTTTRTGGYSFTVPIPKLSELKINNGALILAKAINVPLTAFAINGSVREICIHSCIGQGGVTTSNYGNSQDYHSNGDDVMPYFMSFNFMRMCGADPNADLTLPPSGTADSHWTTCPNMTSNQMATTSINIRALGVAAHLDSSNDFYQQPGMVLQPSYTYGSTLPPAANEAGPFFELWCHRRTFMQIQYFLNYTNFPRPNLLPSQTVGDVPYRANHVQMQAYFAGLFSPGVTGGYRPNALALPMDFMYYSGPGHPNAGWDAYPLTTTTNYQYNQANDLTPWFGCGA